MVIVFDENQVLRMDQYWESQMIDKYRNKAIEQENHFTLTEQLRMKADKDTLDWIDSFTKSQIINKIPHNSYEIKIFDSPVSLVMEIRKKASKEETRLSRLIANYDWDYKENSRPQNRLQKYWEVLVKRDNWHKPWNYELKKELAKINVNSFSTSLVANFADEKNIKDLNQALVVDKDKLKSNYEYLKNILINNNKSKEKEGDSFEY